MSLFKNVTVKPWERKGVIGGLEPEGALRVGILHYNTAEEVDRFLEVLSEILG